MLEQARDLLFGHASARVVGRLRNTLSTSWHVNSYRLAVAAFDRIGKQIVDNAAHRVGAPNAENRFSCNGVAGLLGFFDLSVCYAGDVEQIKRC